MRYVKQDLIKACDLALQRDRQRWTERRAAELESHSAQVKNWLARHSAEWAEAGLAIRRALREGAPVTREMLPMDRRHSSNVAIFAPQFNFEREYEPPRELAFLRRVLDVVADDEVTTSGLEKIGVSTKTMRDAAWYMAVGSAKE